MNSFKTMLKQVMLVIVMIGLEAGLMVKILLMVANLQTLGVSISLTSVPGTVSAGIGIVSIPLLGLFMDRLASSTRAKAGILIFVSSILMIGSGLVTCGNVVKMMGSTQESTELRHHRPTHYSYIALQNVTANTSSEKNPNNAFDLFYETPSDRTSHDDNGGIAYFAILAMIGYAMLDNGYDSSSCFLKTFALACSHPDDHASIIIKSVLVSSVGGCLVSLLCSTGLGKHLVNGTDLDPNAAQAVFVSGLVFIFTLFGLISTLTTGFCCPPWNGTRHRSVEETSRLLNKKDVFDEKTAAAKAYRSSSFSASYQRETYAVIGKVNYGTGVTAFLKQYKRQIIINITTFFLLGAMYSFENYCSNFAGISIFHGHPSAKVGSDEYDNYLKGIEAGGKGSMIYYITFTIATYFLEKILDRFGNKMVVLFCSIILGSLCLGLAISSNVWVFYATCVWLGVLRSVATAVPYILAAKIGSEQNGEGNTGVYISVVSAMLPLSFTICCAIMGPLIDATGNHGAPIFYAAACSFMAAFSFAFLQM